MLVIAVLRSFLPAPRRGTVVVLLIAAVIASTVSMHAVCGLPSDHVSTHESWATTVAGQGADQVGSADAALDRTTEPAHPHGDGGQCHGTTTMCLAVVASFLPLAALRTGVVSWLVAPLAQHHFPVDSHQRPMTEPSLQALGICRT
jgi:hypothetical protein